MRQLEGKLDMLGELSGNTVAHIVALAKVAYWLNRVSSTNYRSKLISEDPMKEKKLMN